MCCQYGFLMQISLAATATAEGVWTARAGPQDLALLGAARTKVGPTSVVLLTEPPGSTRAGTIEFRPSTATVLNLGTSDHAVVVLSADVEDATDGVSRTRMIPATSRPGDEQFLRDLPPTLVDLGKHLLGEVRNRWPGELQYHPTSKRFVDSPDNFWTVKIQPRDGSLRLTVRGEPDRLRGDGSLDIKPDQNGYSTFKLSRTEDVPAVMALLSRVRRR